MSKVLITGGAGFIGSYTAKALLARGDEVVVLDDFNSFIYPGSLKQSRLTYFFDKDTRPQLIHGNILDGELVERLCADEKFDKIVHFAAHANPGFSMREPDPYAVVNVLGTLKMLEAATRHEVAQFIFAGSSSIYDDAQTPFREDSSEVSPKSPYGASKAAAELYCSVWHENHDLPITILRFFSVYGPWGRPDMAPMIFARRVLADEIVEVTSDRQRDLTYIDDAMQGVLAAIDRTFDYEVINIGSGSPVEMSELVAAIGKAVGKPPKLQSRPAPPGEMHITFADTSKAQRLLGYAPKVTVQEGADRLVKWLQEWGNKVM